MIKLRCFSLLALFVSSTLGAKTSIDMQKPLTPQERFEQQFLPSSQHSTRLKSNSVQKFQTSAFVQAELQQQIAVKTPDAKWQDAAGTPVVYRPDHQGRLVPEVLADAIAYTNVGKVLKAPPAVPSVIVSPAKTWRGKTFVVQADGQVTDFAAVSAKAATSLDKSKSGVALFGQLNSVQAQQDDVLISSINFVDDRIKNCVSWSGAEYASQVQSLNCGEALVLSDLTHFKNLRHIQLYNFSTSFIGKFSFDDITPLAELPALSSVRFDNYLLSDSDVLELTTKASKLGSLAINGAELTDSAVSALMPAKDRLYYLSLEHNDFSSFSWLSVFSSLQDLDISYNNLSDQAIQELHQLPETISWLRLRGNKLSERPFTVPKQVRHLYLDNNGFTELAQISASIDDVALLEGLSLSENQIADLSGLADFTALSRLFVEKNDVLQNLNFLADLPVLNDLYLSHSLVPKTFPSIKWSATLSRITLNHGVNNAGQLRDISQLIESLKPLPAFSYIDLYGHNGIDCEQIEQLKQLQSEKGWYVQYPQQCGVVNTLIADIEFKDAQLKACVDATNARFTNNVTWLSCGGVSDLSGLEHFLNLTGIQLHNYSGAPGKIVDHTPLTKLPRLMNLNYNRYQLTAQDLSFLKDMSETLQHLYLVDNNLDDDVATQLEPMKSRLVSLDLGQNPITDLSWLGSYSSLQQLYLSNTLFTAIELPASLRNLGLSSNTKQLKDISQLIQQLAKLTEFSELDLMNQISIPCQQIEQLKQLQNEKGWNVQYPQQCGIEKIAITDIDFKDMNLKACVENTGAQFSSDITWLSCGEVTDLTGLDKLSNLVGIQLYSNSNELQAIADHTPLTRLKNLTSFYYNGYNLSASDLDFLKEMPQSLAYLYLWSNNLTDDVAAKIQPLKSQLRVLGLSNNRITDSQWLNDFPVLESLNIGNNPLNDSSVANLHKLTNVITLQLGSLNLAARSFTLPSGVQHLDLWSNGFAETSQFLQKIADKAAVASLNIGDNPIANLSALHVLQNMKELGVQSNTVIADFSFVNNLSQLEILDLSYTNIKSLQGLQLPLGIRFLRINRGTMSAYWLEDISAFTDNLASYTDLTQLDLIGQIHLPCVQIAAIQNAQSTRFFHFNGPSECGVTPKHANTLANVKDPALFQCIRNYGAYLEDIDFIPACYGNFTDLTALKFLTKLNYLDLYNTAAEPALVECLDEVFSMPNLQYLTLSGFNLGDADISALSGNNSLAYLDLPQNKLTQASWPVFASMGALQTLVLSNNAITSLEGIQAVAGLSYLDILNNPVTDLKPVQELKDLTSLSITVNSASILNGLRLSNKIYSLNIEGSGLLSVSPVIAMLEEPSSLLGLSLRAPALKDLSGLSTLSGLTWLYLYDAKPATGIAEVSDLSDLTQLGLYDTTIGLSDIAKRIPHLMFLSLSGENFADISLLTNATELKHLYLYNTHVSSLKPVHTLPKLSSFYSFGYPLTCAEMSAFEAAQPEANASFDFYCLSDDGKSITIRSNRDDITAVEFQRDEDKALGTFEWTGSWFKFVPAKGVTGKQTLLVTVTLGNSSYTFSLTLFVNEEGEAKVKRRIPIWVIWAASQAADK